MATVEETMLIFVSGADNNNKFYHVTLHDDDSVTARWGRVGQEGTLSNKGSGRGTYERCIHEKERKGYKRTEIEASTTKAISSGNGANGLDVQVAALVGLVPANVSPEARASLDSFIRRIVAENRHAITAASGGLITVSDDGIVRTALGVVSLGNIQKARVILDRLAAQTDKGAIKQSDLDEYLTYIPQKVPARRGWGDTFLTKVTTIDKQRDLLDQLESSVALAKTATAKAIADAQKAAKTTAPSIDFRYSLDVLDPKGKEFKRIEKMFEETKNSRHHRDVSALKLKRVYVVTDSDAHMTKWKAAKDKLSNVRELWHGTLTGNLLSILRKGLFVPPVRGTTIRIAGRMFGDGIYFSDQSTKSLNYSHGFWGGSTGGGSRDNCFMLLNEVVLGNEYRPYQQGGWAGTASLNAAHNGTDAKGKPFNSINIKGGTCGVLNNEIIVWDVEQIRVSYICEFDK